MGCWIVGDCVGEVVDRGSVEGSTVVVGFPVIVLA